jgi:hypothetical protein
MTLVVAVVFLHQDGSRHRIEISGFGVVSADLHESRQRERYSGNPSAMRPAV